MRKALTQAQAYRLALAGLKERESPFLVGGTYAFAHFTGISRPTKDLDLFVRPADRDHVLADLRALGWRTHVAYPHWLAKAEHAGRSIDVIHSSGNGVAPVDEEWFSHARPGLVLGLSLRLTPAEEMIWSKAFVMEKYRFDGGDVAHLLLRQGPQLDWDRLLRRFASHKKVLLAHLVLFDFIYPGQTILPAGLLRGLAEAALAEPVPEADASLCRGVLLSRKQYRTDTEDWGLRDARIDPDGSLSADEVQAWTEADPPAPGPDAEKEV
jgi:hypothetical protein